ncbi:hypothetical protein [Runella sp. SP2]|uniref:hypothetical protein n=1 Tax=Runella sp. SP2 TaxID=2268026 RepID=UPI000F09072E|nr:hypothetical protein [Runella sp. SP2]AYQ36599.1 hypothetical protein DTQ70_30220 [Runella sp. SP2]
MFRIAESRSNNIEFLLRPRNYTQVYNRLKMLLSVDQLAFFARPDVQGEVTLWSSETAGSYQMIREYASLAEDEKDRVADTVEEQKAAIVAALSKYPEFEPILTTLFILPDPTALKVLKSGEQLTPILTQWGSKNTEVTIESDPITALINRPRSTTAIVTVEVIYTDGEPAASKDLWVEYLSAESKERTNKDGLYHRGRCKLNTTFKVYDRQDNQPLYIHEFTVVPDGKYIVLLPYLTTANIKVVDQKNRPVSGVEVQVTFNEIPQIEISDKTGQIVLKNLEAGQIVVITEKDNLENTLTYKLKRDKNEYVLKVYRPVMAEASLRVIDQEGNPQSNLSVSYHYEGVEKEGKTDGEGALWLGSFEAGKEVKVYPKNRPDTFKVFRVEEGQNEFILEVFNEPPKFVKVNLIDYDKEPIPDASVGFKHNGQELQSTTDAAGTFTIPLEWFKDWEKVKATIDIKVKGKKGKEETKRFNDSFIFKADQLEYTIQLKKKKPWWLLLFLLLPLLLLIRLEKDIHVKTVDAKSQGVIRGAEVTFAYTKAFVYDDGHFFTNDSLSLRQKSDSSGVASFLHLEYSVYSWIFKHWSKAQIWSLDGCYASDTLRTTFHELSSGDTLRLSMTPVMVSLDFKAVDKADQAALPQTKISIIAELSGITYTDTATSASDGRVVFYRLPKCGRILSVRGEHEGYFPDSIVNKNVVVLAGSIGLNRLLQLQPIRKPISFFVVDCITQKPIAGAVAEIEFDFNGIKSKSLIQTNTDGLGKGTYDEAYVIALIHLQASAPYYQDGELPGQHLVQDFIDPVKFPKEKRTFCLQPKPNPIEFKNIDERTQQPLAGVKNIVKIVNAAGAERTEIIESNTDGNFTISVNTGDQVSIVSQLQPDYEDNSTKIQNKDGMGLVNGPPEDRIIPLKPKEVEVLFRTIDGNSGQILPNTDLVVSVDGQVVPPTNSGTGEFKVKMPVNAFISIVASKAGYGSNDTKVNNQLAKFLQTSTQDARDIPLRIVPKPCIEPQESGQDIDFEQSYDMGTQNKRFQIEYNMFSVPDQLVVYCGKQGENGKIIFNQGMVTGQGIIDVDLAGCNSTWITVKVNAGPNGTEWRFNFICPNN